jgi:hypothetical protein
MHTFFAMNHTGGRYHTTWTGAVSARFGWSGG